MIRQTGLTCSHKRKYRPLKRMEKLRCWLFHWELVQFKVVKARGFGIFTVDHLSTGKRSTIKIPWYKSLI